MRSVFLRRLVGALILSALLVSPLLGDELEEIVVKGVSVAQKVLDSSSVSSIDENSIEVTAAFHPSEILAQVPGVWVTRNSGQEHLTAIRSGVLTGAGACGAFLLLENGVPVRPAGFCNVNGLFEINTEQASQIEVIRGPASSRYGGNALYGVINAITFSPDQKNKIGVRLGSDAFRQIRFNFGDESFSVRGHTTDTDGYRIHTGLQQHKANVETENQFGEWNAHNMLSVSKLEQETGGYVGGFQAYRDSALRFSNPNPEAYRNASSLRLMSFFERESVPDSWTLSPYLRSSSMEFLQHFLPGQPLEQNSQTSTGLVARKSNQSGNIEWNVSGQFEYMDAELQQTQDNPTTGSAFLVATRPAGTHYDYSVTGLTVAGFYDLAWQLTENVQIHHLGRVENLSYDYTNHHLVGNTKDDGTNCGFGGCLYSRPADREDSFTNLGLSLGIERELNDEHQIYALIASGFRPPQSTELYRLQSGQQIADLRSEELVSGEIGLKRSSSVISYQIAFYSQRASNLVLRDAEGFNVSVGRTEGHGIEWDLQLVLTDSHRLNVAGSSASHEYDFTRTVSRGEMIVAGSQVDSAPEQIGGITWSWHLPNGIHSRIQLSYVGEHKLDAANTASYKGHAVLSWFGGWEINENFTLQGRLTNLLDKKYADRADFAFGSYRYFPAPPRQFMVGLQYHLN